MKTDSAIVTIDDKDAIDQLVSNLRRSPFRDQQQLDLLDEILQNVDVITSKDVPNDVIRISSTFRVLDMQTGRRVRYTLVFPEDADISEGRISILAPLGTAVLGHRRGDTLEAKVPGGTKRLKIEHVLHKDSTHIYGTESKTMDGAALRMDIYRPGHRWSVSAGATRHPISDDRSDHTFQGVCLGPSSRRTGTGALFESCGALCRGFREGPTMDEADNGDKE